MPTSRRKIVLLVIAGLIALLTVLAARSLLKTPEKIEAQSDVPKIEILIAKKDLPAGTFVTAADVEWKQWPSNTPHQGMVTKGSGPDDYTGAVVRNGLRAGEPVTIGRLIVTSDRGFMSAVLSPGMRAMTVKITPSSGVAGFVFPNDYVDIIMTNEVTNDRSDEDAGRKRQLSQTVLENIRVLALDQKTNDQDKEAKIAELATLEVTPKQAEKLAIVSQISELQTGRLTMALRSISDVGSQTAANDLKNVDTSGLDPKLVEAVKQALPPSMPEVKSGKKPSITWDSDVNGTLPAPPDLQATSYKVQIYRGSESSNVVFSGNN